MNSNLSNHKIEVTLEQITPYVNDINLKDNNRKEIIRTTEFKPRFDKFLVNKLRISENSKLLISREKQSDDLVRALDYKIMIKKIEKSEPNYYSKRESMEYFKTSGNKYFVRKEGVRFKLIFFSFKSELINIIRENLPEFLAMTNFGKRKNKCFGSFYISEEDPLYKDIDDIEILKRFKFFKEGKENKNFIEMNLKNTSKELNFFKRLDKDLEISGVDPKKKKAIIILRGEGNRKESLAIMKILKKGGKYRLYIIPNFPVLQAMNDNFELDEYINKSFKDFDKDLFFNEIKKYLDK